MVRVGGGWDTLERYLDKHDPCRCPSSGGCPQRAAGGGPLCGSAPHGPPGLSPRSPPPTAAEGLHLLPTEGVTHPQPSRGQPSPGG